MALFGSNTITLTTGEIILKAEVAVVTPLKGRAPAEGQIDYRSYYIIMKSGHAFEVLERNQTHDSMVTALGFS